MLPDLVDTSGIITHTDVELFGEKIPIAGVAGDQQAALFGQTCFEPGMAKNTYGTGCFMLMNTGDKFIRSDSGLISTIAWKIGSRVEYALEGSVFIAGAAVKWLRDALRIVKSAAETEQAAIEAGDSGQVYVVPAFAGLGAPYWDMHARGAILGLTQGVTDKHIVRATLEAIAYQSKDLLKAMEKDSGINLKSLNVDGGASANNFLMQFQSDILNAEVSRPVNIETTALGAAFLAGLAIGFWNWENLRHQKATERVFVPEMNEETRNKLYKGWQRAVARAMSWEQE
jgi:glycerol kinase